MRHVAIRFDGAKTFHWFRDRRANEKNTSEYFGSRGEPVYRHDAGHKDDCPADTVPAHCIANLVAVLMGDYPVPYFRQDSVPPVSGHERSYMEIARGARVDMETVACNYETIWTDKGTSRDPTPSPVSGTLVFDGKMYGKVRTPPSLLTLAVIVGRAEWERICAMFAHYLGDNFLDRYSTAEILDLTRQRYVAGDRDTFDRFAAAPFLTTEHTLVINSIIKVIGKGEVCDSAFRLDNAKRRRPFYPVVHGVEQNVNSASGTIHLRLTDTEYDRILAHGQVASFLDGGVATVELGDSLDEWSPVYEGYSEPYEQNK